MRRQVYTGQKGGNDQAGLAEYNGKQESVGRTPILGNDLAQVHVQMQHKADEACIPRLRDSAGVKHCMLALCTA